MYTLPINICSKLGKYSIIKIYRNRWNLVVNSNYLYYSGINGLWNKLHFFKKISIKTNYIIAQIDFGTKKSDPKLFSDKDR